MGILLGRTHGVRGGLGQALEHASRRRLRGMRGSPDLFRTHAYDIPTAAIAAASFPTRDVPITFATAILITANSGTHQGLIFELGDATTAVAAWVDDDGITFRAGDTGDDAAAATFTTGTGELPVGRLFELVFAVRPGDGRVRAWDGSIELARATAVNGALPNGWAAASNGAFGAAAVGALPADVTRTGAPAGFMVVRPLSVFAGQAPRHFV